MQEPGTDEGVAVRAGDLAKGLRERTDGILAEALPEEITHLLVQLRESNPQSN